MKVQKKVIGNLEKCYSLSLLDYQGKTHILAAAEKVNQCRMYDLEGNLEEVIWEEPGGAMSIVPIPGGNGQFLATHRFYSPNESKDASIVLLTPTEQGWKVKMLVKLPFVHRFDILKSGEKKYLIACTIKSGHAYRDDWSTPGKVYGAELPEDLTAVDEDHPLKLQVLHNEVQRNHGYFHEVTERGEAGIVASELGVFRFRPPAAPDALPDAQGWQMEQLLDVPASDLAFIDLDGCGEPEMVVFSPFHGDTFSIYKKLGDEYQKVYELPEKLEFLHAICCGEVDGIPVAFIGYRKGKQELLAVTADRDGGFCLQKLDSGCGPANVLFYQHQNKNYLLAANREIDEIAWYRLGN